MGEIYAQALEASGFEVERQLGIGPRDNTQAAITGGQVDMVPEYIGSLERGVPAYRRLGRDTPSPRRRAGVGRSDRAGVHAGPGSQRLRGAALRRPSSTGSRR